jgi:hypothetical protein
MTVAQLTAWLQRQDPDALVMSMGSLTGWNEVWHNEAFEVKKRTPRIKAAGDFIFVQRTDKTKAKRIKAVTFY